MILIDSQLTLFYTIILIYLEGDIRDKVDDAHHQHYLWEIELQNVSFSFEWLICNKLEHKDVIYNIYLWIL